MSFAAGALSAESVEDHAADFAVLGARLGPNASLILWSCETGQGELGEDFIDALASASGAKVVAGTGFIGATARGGSWDLDSGGATSVPAPLSGEGIASYRSILAIRTWRGPGLGTPADPTSGNWNTGANWGGNIPSNNDTIVLPASGIPGPYTVTLDIPASDTLGETTLNSGATLAVGANSLRLNGTSGDNTLLLSIGLGATVSVTTGGSKTAGGVTVSGTLTGAGTVTVSANGTATHTINGTGAITATGGLLHLSNQLTGTTTLTTTSVADTLQFSAAGNTASSLALNGGTLRLNAAATTLVVTNAVAIGAGTVDLAAAGATLTDTAGLTLAGGSIIGLGSVAANTNISGQGTIGIGISTSAQLWQTAACWICRKRSQGDPS